MLISEVKNWKYIITWDNASPEDSSSMRDGLEKLGTMRELTPSTTIVLYPKASLGVGNAPCDRITVVSF